MNSFKSSAPSTDSPANPELRVLHVLPRWNHGGGATSILVEARRARETASKIRHEVITLEPGASIPLLRQALEVGLRVHSAPLPAAEAALVSRARVLVLHYWNAPSVRRFLDRWRGRSLRWILYCRINGLHPPQRLPLELSRTSNFTILTSPHLLPELATGGVEVIPALVEPGPVSSTRNRRRSSAILHAGTLNVFKLSPTFIQLHADPPTAAPVTVAGTGGDQERFRAEAAGLGVSQQFSWPGFVDDLTPLYRSSRILSYPLSRYTYASSDKVVQESQLQGLAVLTFRTAPVAHLIREGVTGWLADDEQDYRALLGKIEEESIELPQPECVSRVARELHSVESKLLKLNRIYREVADSAPSVLDDGFPDLYEWVRFQTGDPVEARANQRPSLEALRADPRTLEAHQRWACEGGLAHYLNNFPEIPRPGEPR